MANKILQESSAAMVRTGMWEDEQFIDSHSVEDRFVMFYLLTSPHRHVSGVLKINYRLICSHLGWDKQQVLIVLDRLEKLHDDIMIDGGFVWVKSWYDHNALPSPTHFKQIGARIAELTHPMLDQWLSDAVDRGIDIERIGYRYPIDRVSGNTNTNTNYKDNNNGQIQSEVGGEGGLVFPKALDVRLVESVRKMLGDGRQAQEILDELAAGIESGTIKNPLPWISAVMARGLNRTPAGLKKEDQRLALRG